MLPPAFALPAAAAGGLVQVPPGRPAPSVSLGDACGLCPGPLSPGSGEGRPSAGTWPSLVALGGLCPARPLPRPASVCLGQAPRGVVPATASPAQPQPRGLQSVPTSGARGEGRPAASPTAACGAAVGPAAPVCPSLCLSCSRDPGAPRAETGLSRAAFKVEPGKVLFESPAEVVGQPTVIF